MNPLDGRQDHQYRFDSSHRDDGASDLDFKNKDFVNDSDPLGMFAARGVDAPPIPTPEKLREDVASYAARIFANQRLLQQILDRHEATIQKRWEKRGKAQRLAVLLELWPNMPPTHRPDFAAFRRHGSRTGAPGEREAFMWPMINQEDLVEARALLLLLKSRGRNTPSTFAGADGDSMSLGKITMAIVPIFLNLYTIVLNGVTKEEEYGELLAWSDHDEAFALIANRTQYLPGEGLLIMEFQDRMFKFLLNFCRKILHEIPPDLMTGKDYPMVPEPALKPITDVSGSLSLAILAKEAPYRPPALLDLDNIESLLGARVARAQDNIWALREDPSYFMDTMSEMKEHRQEMIKDTNGQAHPTLRPGREGLLWTRIIGSVLIDSLFQLEIFAELLNQARHLKTLKEKYAKSIKPAQELPEEYLYAILKFRHYLQQTAKGPMNQLKISAVASPPLRHMYLREPPASALSTKLVIIPKDIRVNMTTELLLWLLRTLWEDGQPLFFARLTTVVDELDRFLRTDSEAAELVSPYIADCIGELSIVGECLRQFEIYQPWANMFDAAMVAQEEGIKEEFAEKTEILSRALAAFDERNVSNLGSLGAPVDGKFNYPVGKKHNKVNVEQMRAAEANLDKFWAAVDELLATKARGLENTAYKRLLLEHDPIQRTPEWVEPEKKAPQTKKKDVTEEVPMSKLFFEKDPVPSISRRQALEMAAAMDEKAKVKTRGEKSQSDAVEAAQDEQTTPSEETLIEKPTFAVDARALKVFRIVFFNPQANITAGEVAWRDFIHAMTSIGFAPQKLLGSAWQFQPLESDAGRSIQFHEPHPKGKLAFVVARRYGRRLTRNFGWSGDMFVLKEKEN